jgi:hypothetical protein
MDSTARSTASAVRGPSTWRTDVVLFLLAAAVVAVPALRALGDHDMDPTTLLRVGRYSAARELVEQDFQDPVLTEDYGHDGQQFYVLAATFPFLEDAQGNVDRLRYRARRVLLPAVTSPVPRGAPLVWAMFGVNVAAVGAAAIGVGRLARRLGTTPWLGLVVAVTPAMVESVEGTLADAPAFALAIWGVVVWRRRPWLAAALFLLAALSRDTTIVVPLACALVAWRGRTSDRDVRGAVVPMLASVGGFAVWAVAVNLWLPPTQGAISSNFVADAFSQFALPFTAWFDVGITSFEVMVGVLLLVGGLVAAWMLRDQLPELSLWLVADAALLIIADESVVGRAQNFARVAPLALTALALALGRTYLSRVPHDVAPEPA